jgi:tetratricopeptide (TPR) repeat protein
MLKATVRCSVPLFFFVIFVSFNMAAQTAPRPLRASEVMALEAGGALQENIAHDIATRGLNFQPNEDFVALLKKAGADASVLDALKSAQVSASGEAQPDHQVLVELGDAGALMKQKKYVEAAKILSDALDSSFARMETGYVMAELLRQQERYDVALNVYGEILQNQPDFPELHVKTSFVLYKVGDTDNALNEAKAALAENANDAEAHKDIGRVLMAKKDYAGALEELSKAESLAQSSWEIHDLYGQALEENAQIELAIGQFKEAVALNPTKAYAMMQLGKALEKKGDWPAALEQYQKAGLTDSGLMQKGQAGQQVEVCGDECSKQYTAAQARFRDYLESLKSSGRGAEAEELQKKVAQLENAGGTEERVEKAIKAGDQAFQGRRMEEAEKSYKEAVELAKNLPPGNQNMIVALGRLGGIYGTRQDFSDALATLHQELELVEKTYGPGTTQSVEPLQQLAMVSAWQKNYTEAESYLQKVLEINSKMAGDNDARAVDSLRQLAGLYMSENDYSKAEIYLLRAVKGAEQSNDQLLLFPLWGLCDMYDRWGKPDKSQPCWHRATEVMEKQVGQRSPKLAESLTKEANALRKMGKTEEALRVEERVSSIRRASK